MLIKLGLFIPLCAYCILDYFHTVTLVSLGMSEANPIVLWLVGEDKWYLLLYAKIVLLVFLGVLIVIDERK